MEVGELHETLIRKIKILSETTWDRRADGIRVEKWLKNFSGEKEKIHSLFLLSQFMYFGEVQMKELLRALYRDLFKYPVVEQIRRENGDTVDLTLINSKFTDAQNKTVFIGVGNPSESGTHLLYFFRQENRLSRKRFINVFEIFDWTDPKNTKLKHPNVDHYVFIDDFCGSGSQAGIYSSDVIQRIQDINPKVKTSYLMLFATKFGKSQVKSKTKFDYVEALVELDDSFKCFDSNSRYFENSHAIIDKAFAKQINEKYGFDLFKSILENDGKIEPILSELSHRHKLGFGDCQLLIGFFHNTPDNTLPTIWYDEQHLPWYPIFKRYNKIY